MAGVLVWASSRGPRDTGHCQLGACGTIPCRRLHPSPWEPPEAVDSFQAEASSQLQSQAGARQPHPALFGRMALQVQS